MEYLRWILLAAGIFFILFIYLFGRKRRQQNNIEEFDSQEDVPEFSAQNWDDLDEGVGEVRIVARENSAEYVDEPAYDLDSDDSAATVIEDDIEAPELETSNEDDAAPQQSQKKDRDANTDIIVLHIIGRSEQKFAGDKINSVTKSNRLVFGNMNIFHRVDDNGQSIYSLANMVEPGSFDPENMHDLRTPGLIMFMQISEVSDPEAAFDDMLRCAYNMAEMLDGQLCNRQRQALTQSDAEHYRELVAGVNA